MQWILQNYEDTSNLAVALERFGIDHSFHKVVPFVGELTPEPEIKDPSKVLLFGSYGLRHYAKKNNLTPGVFELRPFFYEKNWEPYLLNGPRNSDTATVREMADIADLSLLEYDHIGEYLNFIRPIEDSKEIAGTVMTYREIVNMCQKVMAVPEEDLIRGSLGHDTLMMLSEPTNIYQEWRIWVVNNKIITYSQYKQGRKVLYLPYIDDDALQFANRMIELNSDYSPAYVLDVCRTEKNQLSILETNCINAAGLYAADLNKLVMAFEEGF